MAYINMEWVLNFHSVMIHITEVGKVITTVPGIPEAVDPK